MLVPFSAITLRSLLKIRKRDAGSGHPIIPHGGRVAARAVSCMPCAEDRLFKTPLSLTAMYRQCFERSIAGRSVSISVSRRLFELDIARVASFRRNLSATRERAIEEIKSVPYIPVSHPFIERLIGTVRREYLDRLFFWNSVDLTRKLEAFRNYYNEFRATARLAAPRLPSAPERPRRALLCSIPTHGGSILTAYFVAA